MRVVVTGGGTGGHIFPAIAICEALRQEDAAGEILYIGGSSGMETEIVPAASIPFQSVTARKMPPRPSIATLRGLLALLKGHREASSYLKAFRAECVVGTGGYVSAAVLLAAARLRIPSLLLESNVIAGRANRVLAKYARNVCISFEESIGQFPRGRCLLTGLPLRSGIVAPAELSKEDARRRFPGLAPDRFTVLVIGGSQGARAINKLIVAAARTLLAQGIQFLHQTGPTNEEDVKSEAEAAGILHNDIGYVLRPFIASDEMPAALRAADVIVCRGGISTLSEATANGVPALVIPLPSAYADHQTANARAIEKAGAGIYLPEAELTGEKLAGEILQLSANSEQLDALRQASSDMGRPNAAWTVAATALALRQGRPMP